MKMTQDSQPGNKEHTGLYRPPALIFMAEDDIDDQELLMEAINRYAPTITFKTATNGKKALVLLESLPDTSLPSLIVLDYNLPELNGAQILEALHQHERFCTIPIVVWSTSDSELYKNHSIRLGAKAYFVKPSDLAGIQALAKQMLAFCNR